MAPIVIEAHAHALNLILEKATKWFARSYNITYSYIRMIFSWTAYLHVQIDHTYVRSNVKTNGFIVCSLCFCLFMWCQFTEMYT